MESDEAKIEKIGKMGSSFNIEMAHKLLSFCSSEQNIKKISLALNNIYESLRCSFSNANDNVLAYQAYSYLSINPIFELPKLDWLVHVDFCHPLLTSRYKLLQINRKLTAILGLIEILENKVDCMLIEVFALEKKLKTLKENYNQMRGRQIELNKVAN